MEKKLIEIKEIYEYTGKCPKCGIEEKSDNSKNVDIFCDNCGYLQKKENVRDICKQLIDGMVIDIDNDDENLISITMKTVNGKEYMIESYGDGTHLHMHEIK